MEELGGYEENRKRNINVMEHNEGGRANHPMGPRHAQATPAIGRCPWQWTGPSEEK